VIDPSWIGYENGGLKLDFLYTIRRYFVFYSLSLDNSDDVEYHKGLSELLGFYCNPEFYQQRKKAEDSEKHVNLGYQALLERVKEGFDPFEDEDEPVL